LLRNPVIVKANTGK